MSYYRPAAMAYGLVRKVADVKDGTVQAYDEDQRKYVRTPLFLTDKVAATMVSTLAAPFLLPIYIVADLYRLEKWLDPEKARLYPDERKSAIDYFVL